MIRANLVCLVVPPVIIVVTDVETLCAAAVVIVNYRVVGCRHCGCSSALSLWSLCVVCHCPCHCGFPMTWSLCWLLPLSLQPVLLLQLRSLISLTISNPLSHVIDVVIVACHWCCRCELSWLVPLRFGKGEWPLYTLTRGGSQLDSFHAAQIASRKHSDTPLLNLSEATYTTHKDPTQNST